MKSRTGAFGFFASGGLGTLQPLGLFQATSKRGVCIAPLLLQRLSELEYKADGCLVVVQCHVER